MLRRALLGATTLLTACAAGSAPAPSGAAPAATTGSTPTAATTDTRDAPAGTAAPGTSLARRVGTMSELMVDVIYPASDAVFYIATRTPTTSEEWAMLQAQTLMLAESANLLMMPGRARDQGQWMADALLMLEGGEAAYRAAKDRDVAGVEAASDALHESCVTCHRNYRPDYGRRD